LKNEIDAIDPVSISRMLLFVVVTPNKKVGSK